MFLKTKIDMYSVESVLLGCKCAKYLESSTEVFIGNFGWIIKKESVK